MIQQDLIPRARPLAAPPAAGIAAYVGWHTALLLRQEHRHVFQLAASAPASRARKCAPPLAFFAKKGVTSNGNGNVRVGTALYLIMFSMNEAVSLQYLYFTPLVPK